MPSGVRKSRKCLTSIDSSVAIGFFSVCRIGKDYENMLIDRTVGMKNKKRGKQLPLFFVDMK